MKSSNVTTKGQVTIPIEIRKKWNLTDKDRVIFIEKDNKVELKPAFDFFSLQGSIKTKKKYSDKKADESIKNFIKKQHKK